MQQASTMTPVLKERRDSHAFILRKKRFTAVEMDR